MRSATMPDETSCQAAVGDAVIEDERELHHRAWHDLRVDDPRPCRDPSDAEDRRFRRIDDRGPAVDPERSEVRHREGAAPEVGRVDRAVARGGRKPREIARDHPRRFALRVANHRDHETAIGLHRDPEMDRVEGDDLVGLRVEMRVEARESLKRANAEDAG